MLDLAILDSGIILDFNDNGDQEYEGEDLTIPPRRYEKLETNGEEFDLRKPKEAEEANDTAKGYREQLKNDDLSTYEGKSTEVWGGGRSRLLYDEIRTKYAIDYHAGKHTMTWEQQHFEANRAIKIYAARIKAQGL